MNYESTNERFLTIEERLNVFESSIEGIQVWDWIRTTIAKKIKSKIDEKDSISSSNTVNNSSRIISCLKSVYQKNPFWYTSKDAVFYSHGRRKRLDDGLWWDPYIDPLLTDFDRSHVCLENYKDSKHSTPAKSSNLVYNDLLQCISGFLKRASPSAVEISSQSHSKIQTVETTLENEFDIQINLEELIRNTVKSAKYDIRVHTTWLKLINPQIVITWARPRALILSCKRLGIPVLELQHGVIHRYHYEYSYPHAENVEAFPDQLCVFGDHWKNAVSYPIKQDKIQVLGFPFANMQKKRYSEALQKNQIIFLSQPTVSGKRLSRIAAQCSNEFDLEYDIIYKLHPREEEDWEDMYPWLQDADLRVATSLDEPLYELLARSSIQVGASSTALFEGILFDLETYILDNDYIVAVQYLLDNGAKVIDSAPTFVSKIENTNRSKVNHDVLFEKTPEKTFNEIVSSVIENCD